MTRQEFVNSGTAHRSYLERPRYFPCQLVTAADLTLGQDYFRAKLRRHNRMLHGWGVVCGAQVRKGENDNEIVVERGYVLGPYGDEIFIHTDETVNINDALVGKIFPSTEEEMDPWCSDGHAEPLDQGLYYVVIRYVECQDRPIEVASTGGGCGEPAYEYSRILDGFEIKILDSLPDTYSDPMLEPDPAGAIPRLCPECPSESWVILADIRLDANGSWIVKEEPDNDAHRRYVASFADYHLLYARGAQLEVSDDLFPTLPVLPDLTTPEIADAPNVLIRAKRSDGDAVYLPIHFVVRSGESYESLLDREGDREFHDPVSDEKFTLRELYAMTAVDPNTTVGSTAEALAPLEGLTLRVADLRAAWEELEDLLDRQGIRHLEREYAYAPGAAAELPVIDVKGVTSRSKLGEYLGDMTVGEAAKMSREEFVTQALDAVPEKQRNRVETQANKVWETATKVAEASKAWRHD